MSGNWQIDSGLTLSDALDATSSNKSRSLIVHGDTMRLTTPRSIPGPLSTGYSGEICWDDNYLYLHTSTGWKRITLEAIV